MIHRTPILLLLGSAIIVLAVILPGILLPGTSARAARLLPAATLFVFPPFIAN